MIFLKKSEYSPPKRYAVIHSEKIFLISFGLVVSLGYLFLAWLVGFLGNLLTANWTHVNAAIQLAEKSTTFPALGTVVFVTILIFCLIYLFQGIGKLFQAFWESLEIDK